MPDTDCAKPQWGSAFQQDCCAMISGSGGHCGKLHLLSRVAGRSNPMTGTDRSNFSCRTLLFLFVLLGMPVAARSDTLEDSARELARRVTAVLSPREGVALHIENNSTLTPGEVERISQTFSSALQETGFGVSSNSGGAIIVRVTLSENVKGFIWSAEIVPSDAPRVVLMKVMPTLADRPASNLMPILLSSEKFWEGPERLLDATIVNTPGSDPSLLFLTTDGMLIRKVGSSVESIVQIPPTNLVTRDPFGVLTQTENGLTVAFLNQICGVDIDARALVGCRPTADSFASAEKIDLRQSGLRSWKGKLIAAIQSGCTGAPLFLASGSGDFTEPDTIQLLEWTDSNGVRVEKPLSDFLHFAGPVMALQSSGAMPRAIVRNLQTENYEAYRISISCGQ